MRARTLQVVLGAMLLLAVALLAATPWASAQAPAGKAELYESSFAHEATSEYQAALSDALQIVKLDPNDYVATLRAGWLSYLRKRNNESIAFYSQAARLAPKAIEPHLGAMLPLMAVSRWADAEREGRTVVQKAPHDYLGTSRLAYAVFSQGRYKEAEVLYRQVLDDYPSDAEMMLGLGWTWLRMGRKPEARQMFDQVLSIRRQNANARAGLEALTP